MALWLLLVENDAWGAASMASSGALGAQDQREAVSALGGVCVSQWASLGRWDAVLVADFPDDAALLAFVMSAGAGGQHVEPVRLLGVDEAHRASELLAGMAQDHASSPPMTAESDRD